MTHNPLMINPVITSLDNLYIRSGAVVTLLSTDQTVEFEHENGLTGLFKVESSPLVRAVKIVPGSFRSDARNRMPVENFDYAIVRAEGLLKLPLLLNGEQLYYCDVESCTLCAIKKEVHSENLDG